MVESTSSMFTQGQPGPGSSAESSPAASSRKPNRIPIYAGVAAAVVLAIVLLVVLLPAPGGSGGSGSGPLSYSTAKPLGDQAASAFDGGGWTLIAAAGFDSATAETFPLNLSSLASTNCTFQAGALGTGSFTIPQFTGNQTAGVAPLWGLAYRNAFGTIAIVIVVNGKASIAGAFSGGECASLSGLFTPVPSDVIDSPQAGAAVASLAAPFLAEYPNASAAYGLLGGFSSLGLGKGAQWEVAFSTCPINSTGRGNGAEFNATVNATSGRVVYSQTIPALSCASGASGSYLLGSSMNLELFSENTTSMYTNYFVSIISATNGITWANLSAVLENDTGATVPIRDFTLTAQTSAGATIAAYDPSTSSWAAGGTRPIVSGDAIRIQSLVTLSGGSLVLTGVGSFYGSIDVGL